MVISCRQFLEEGQDERLGGILLDIGCYVSRQHLNDSLQQQKCTVSQLWRLEVTRIETLARVVPSEGYGGALPVLCSSRSFWGGLAILGVLGIWPSPSCSHDVFPWMCVSMSKIPSLYVTGTLVMLD